MIITGRRIQSITRHLSAISEGRDIALGVTDLNRYKDELKRMGMPAEAPAGTSVLPAALGSVSAYNAEGKYIKHTDQPKETAYRQVEWHWTEWHGPYEVEQSDIVDVPYKIHQLAVRRVNWTILPQGRMPWDQLRRALRPVVEKEPEGNRPVIDYRLEAVNAHQPEFVAVGNAGFVGYLIFAFPKRHLFVLECARFGNATYVFGDDWERLSQMTKAEILDERLQQARLIHRKGWKRALDTLFR